MTDRNNPFKTQPIEAGPQIVEPGDVALLLKKNGAVQALTFGYDRNRLTVPDALLTDEDRAMLEQGRRLFALTFAAGHPKLMQLLIDIAADPEVVNLDSICAMTTRH